MKESTKLMIKIRKILDSCKTYHHLMAADHYIQLASNRMDCEDRIVVAAWSRATWSFLSRRTQ